MLPIMSGSDIFQEIRNFQNDFGKGEIDKIEKKKENNGKRLEPKQMWKKKSIFFDLPFWEHLLVRHNLDVMHIEKNVCESIIKNVKGKSKDGLKSRKALQEMGIRQDLHPTSNGTRTYLPPALYTLSKKEKGREARLCGPVHPRWMYVFERYMKFLKGFVRNKAKPEGSIAKCYLADECMRFCSSFMKQVVELNNNHKRNESFEYDAIVDGRPISGRTSIILSDERLEIAHRYVLFNTDEVKPYEQIHLNESKLQDENLVTDEGLLWKMHAEIFSSWLKDKIIVSDTLKCLAFGPRSHASSYLGYIINGT